MEKSNTPELRFPGFEGEWNSKSFGKLVSYFSTNSFSREQLNYIEGKVFNIHYGDIHTKFQSAFEIKNELIPFINFDIDLSKINGEAYCRVGDMIFADASEDYNDIGKCIEIINIDNKSVLAGLHTIHARPRINVFSLGYPAYFFKSYSARYQIMRESQGTKVLSISSKRLSSINITYPSLPEQQKIASFFTSIDKKIELLKKKHSLLEQYKKGVMQKIFAQKIRFKDSDGNDYADWEEKKLGEVFYSVKGQGLSKDKVILTGKNECILYGELYTTYAEIIYEIASKTNQNEGVKSMKNDLLIPCSTTTTGIDLANVTALNKDNVLLGGDITILRTKFKIYNVFFAYYLSNFKKYDLARFGQGTTIVHLYFSHFKMMKINIPSIQEQTKIANFLSSIDKKIEKVQLQIDKAEEWKKGLLGRMFC
ncbi:MAG: restriction endonuclease subunit S [Bacteroidales bacterium]|nr:restriction endonuclease subunit S [Bacteroidales bacterium]